MPEHYHEPLVWLELLLERQLMGDMGYTINAPVVDVQVGGPAVFESIYQLDLSDR